MGKGPFGLVKAEVSYGSAFTPIQGSELVLPTLRKKDPLVRQKNAPKFCADVSKPCKVGGARLPVCWAWRVVDAGHPIG